MIYLLLYFEFFKVGLFTIGGGLAALPFLYEIAEKYSWFTRADVTNMIAISQSTPGPIGVNAATYYGYEMGGIFGGVIATAGIATPGIIAAMLVAAAITKFQKNTIVTNSFLGIRPTVTALITSAFLAVFTISVLNFSAFYPSMNLSKLIEPRSFLLFVFSFVAMLKFKKHPAIYLLVGVFFGIFFAPESAIV